MTRKDLFVPIINICVNKVSYKMSWSSPLKLINFNFLNNHLKRTIFGTQAAKITQVLKNDHFVK